MTRYTYTNIYNVYTINTDIYTIYTIYIQYLQIIRPINTAALSEWAEDDTFSPKLLKRMAEVAPMLRSLQLTLVNTQQT